MKLYSYKLLCKKYALVAEQVDAADLKSVDRKVVPVQVRPGAPLILLVNQAFKLRAGAEKLSPLIFLNPSKTSTYIFALQKTTLGEQNVRKLYSKVYSICKNLFFKFEQTQAFQGI